jgi:hypothetical protein
MNFQCIICGSTFSTTHNWRKCCSTACGIKYRDRKIKKIDFNCDECGKLCSSTQYKYDQNKAHYCSKPCYWKNIGSFGENNGMFGKTHTDTVRRKLAKLASRRPSTFSRSGKRVDLNNMYFRSSWEANYARYLNYLNLTWEFEPKIFEFPEIKKGCVSYMPDFRVYSDSNKSNYEWVELKGWFTKRSKTKLKRFKKYFPEEWSKLKVITAKDYLNIESKFKDKIPFWEAKISKEESGKRSFKWLKNKFLEKNRSLISDWLDIKGVEFIFVEPNKLYSGILFREDKIDFFNIQAFLRVTDEQHDFINVMMPQSSDFFIIKISKGNLTEFKVEKNIL